MPKLMQEEQANHLLKGLDVFGVRRGQGLGRAVQVRRSAHAVRGAVVDAHLENAQEWNVRQRELAQSRENRLVATVARVAAYGLQVQGQTGRFFSYEGWDQAVVMEKQGVGAPAEDAFGCFRENLAGRETQIDTPSDHPGLGYIQAKCVL